MHGNSALPIGTLYGIAEDHGILSQSVKALKGRSIGSLRYAGRFSQYYICSSDIGPDVPVQELAYDPVARTVLPCPPGSLLLPTSTREQITWNTADGTLRLVHDRKVRRFLPISHSLLHVSALRSCKS